MTFARNEQLRLPIWLKHYQQFVDNQDIYIIDQNTTDGSTDNLPCNIIKEPNEKVFDHIWLRKMLTKNLREKLLIYKIVVLLECDELMFTINNKKLNEYLIQKYADKKLNGATSICDIVQCEYEIDYINTIPISKQRNYWYNWKGACKHTIHTFNNYELDNGFHNGNGKIDDNLITLHFQLLNKQWFIDKIYKRIEERSKYGAGDNHACWTLHYNEDLIQSHLKFYYSCLEKTPDFFNNNLYI